MNIEKLEQIKKQHSEEKHRLGNIQRIELIEVIEAILEEPKKKCPCSLCWSKEIKDVKNG